ncbi:MAG: MGMT family protein [Candidatus Hadarchaeales archaeon]
MRFQDTVLKLVRKVPRGKVTTYGEIAKALGKRAAYRAVGNALSGNPSPLKIPCHRVIRGDGTIGGYIFGTHAKQRMLEKEGIEVTDGRVDLKKYMFRFDSRKQHKRYVL